MKKEIITIALLSASLLSACTDNSGTVEILEKHGYKNVQTHGHDFFQCSEDDFFATKFTATTEDGKKISGAVCKGLLFKGKTIRYD